jgi:hypothetical protein
MVERKGMKMNIIKKLFQRKYRYFVSYYGVNGNKNSINCSIFSCTVKIDNEEQFINIKNVLKTELKCDSIIILNWIRLK